MKTTQLIALIPLLILFLSIRPIAANEQPKPVAETPTDVVVEGIVYCQTCHQYGTWDVDGATPIPSANVSIICKDKTSRVSYYETFGTDKNGYFYGQLKGFKMVHPLLDHPLHACKVKPVSSPLEACNRATNVNYGLNGARLRYEDKSIAGPSYEAVVYAAGPLAFGPAHCGRSY